MVIVGLDCGGSSSRVLATNEGGSVLYQGQSGAANLVSTPPPRLRKHLWHACEGLSGATHVCGCFAGLMGEPQRRNALEILGELFPGARLRAEPDYAAALFASPEGTKACVIAGTGSLICSLNPDGKLVKSGGGGYLLGDEGSGFRYGRAAVLRYIRDPRSVGPVTRELVTKVYKSTDPGEITAAVYRMPAPAAAIARIAKGLAHDAANGLPYAVETVAIESRALALVMGEHLQTHGHPLDALVCLAGGVWKNGRLFEATLREAWQERYLVEPNFVRIQEPPLSGAVRLARDLGRHH